MATKAKATATAPAALLNRMSEQEVADKSAAFGVALANGESSRFDLARHLFDARTQGKVDAREQYMAFAKAALAADKKGAVRINLDNASSVTSQVAKLNAVIELAARNVDKRRKLFDTVQDIVATAPADKKPALSLYECLVKVAVAQVREGDRNLTRKEVEAMLPPKPAGSTRTRLQQLDAIIKACDAYAKAYRDTGGEKDVATARDSLKEARTPLLASVESKSVDTDEELTADGQLNPPRHVEQVDAPAAATLQ